MAILAAQQASLATGADFTGEDTVAHYGTVVEKDHLSRLLLLLLDTQSVRGI